MFVADYRTQFCSALASKASQDPGLPVPNPTPSYWQSEPHTLSNHQSAILPAKADIAIIGSGMTGISTAYHLLQQQRDLRITILEARSLTSGATGRNGGHCKDEPYDDYMELKQMFGKEGAQKIVKFRLAQLGAKLELAQKLGLDGAEEQQQQRSGFLRRVEGLDVFYDQEAFQRIKERVRDYLEDFPEEKDVWVVHEGGDLNEKFGTIDAVGAITGPAGALWPYKLVGAVTTHIFNSEVYPNLTLETHTPVETVSTTDDSDYAFTLKTPRGELQAIHVIHCTNGFAAHLVPGLRGKLYPVRGQMTRQAAAPELPRLGDCRSWILHYDLGYDYVTQSPSPSGDIYIGGGLWKALISGQVSVEDADIGSVRDDLQNQAALDIIETSIEKGLQNGSGTRTVDKWTGIMGFTVDNYPIVGKIPYEISQRMVPAASNIKNQMQGREWIAAGFCGTGMVNCWLTGKAVAEMLLKGEESVRDWFPLEQYACSPERLQRTTLVDRLLEFVEDAVA